MLTFKKFVDAFIVKLFISLLLLWLILVEQSCGYDLYEGDNCELNNGNLGVCVKITECTSVLNNLQSGKITFSNLVHCSFIGTVQVICCEDRTPTQTRKIVTSTETPNQIVFINTFEPLETTIKPPTSTPRLNTNFQDLSLSIYQQLSTTPRTHKNEHLENYKIIYLTPVENNIFDNSNPSLNNNNNNNNAADDKTKQSNSNSFVEFSLNVPQTTKKPSLDSWMLNVLKEKEEAAIRNPTKDINKNINEFPKDVTVSTTKTPITSNWIWNTLQSKEEVTTTEEVLKDAKEIIFENQNQKIISTTSGPVLDDWMLNALKAKEEIKIQNIPNDQNTNIFQNPRQSVISTTSTPVLKTTTQAIESTTQKFNFGGNPFLTKFFATKSPLITNTHFPIIDLWTIDASKDLTTQSNSNKHESIFPIWNINSDNDNDITRKPSTFNPSATPVSRIGRKSVIACEQYSTLAGPSLTFHILDGVPAALGEFPHMAALGYPSISTNEITWDCGGSLISERYVLTAAHCLTRAGPQVSVVRLGVISLNGNVRSDARPVDAGIGNLILHPSYIPSRQYNDIALIQLDRVIQFGDYIRPACLNTNLADVSPNERLIASGWGTVSTRTRAKSNLLLQANLTSVSLTSCNQSHVDYGLNRRYPNGLDEGQMCATDTDTRDLKRDACEGDSGGPLQMKSADNVYTIIGVISFGLGCGTQIPGVYARVAYYLEWIESIVW